MDRTRKRELRSRNERVWECEKNVFAVSGSLDSSLKKNTAFIKRLRTAITTATLSTFLQEIRTLSLHKYLSEIISACYEGLCKVKSPPDVDAAVEIVSALHQRFGPFEFTGHIGWLLGKGLSTPDKSILKALPQEAREREEKDRMTRHRALLRVVTELWLVQVLRTLDDVIKPDDATKTASLKTTETKAKSTAPSSKSGPAEPFPLDALKDLLGQDRDHVNLPLVVLFVRSFSWDILGIKPQGSEGRKGTLENVAPADECGGQVDIGDIDAPFVPAELRDRFKNILAKYFEDVKAHITRDQKSVQNQARRNAEAYVKSGEVFEDRQANFEKQVKAQERLISHAQTVADIIGADMPDVNDIADAPATGNGSIGLVRTGEYLKSMCDGAGIWEDEEERRFYENLVDLKGKVPDILLEDKKKKPEGEDQANKRIDAGELPAGNNKPAGGTDDSSLAIVNKTMGAQVDALLTRLPDMATKDAVDQMAVDFGFLNSKASRNRLIKALTDVPKGRTDLLATWSRLAATLGRHMPDIPKALVEHLDAEFRSLQRRKEKDFLGQVRLTNIRYLAELTKFGSVPEHVLFHCLKVCLDDFSRMNIDIMCNLLENCGRYLLRNADTAPRMGTFLETLLRKKSVQHLGQQERMLIENAIYYVDPPQRPAIEQKERTPMELFVRKLVYSDLTKRNYGKVLKKIRRLHWEEPDVVSILERVFSKPGKVKFGNINVLAILLGALYRYHPSFVVGAIDNVIESICLGLEQNDFRFYQRRLAEVKYLSELYNYRILEHPVIFDILYRITTFGYGVRPPIPGRINPFDLPDDFFRVRLVTTILDACGTYFEKGAAGRKLEYFLSFFQYYILTKDPLPMDIEFLVHDTFSLVRPQWKLANNLDDATKSLQFAIIQDQNNALASANDAAAEADEGASVISSDEDIENVDADGEGAETLDELDSEEEAIAEDHDAESQVSSSWDGVEMDDDEDVHIARQQEEADPQEAADFDREFAKMMSESLESRKFDRKPLFDLALPVRARARDDLSQITDSNTNDGTMAFSLLTKKGNRQQSKIVELPSDSTFAVALRHQQQAEREEQQRIKSLVLNYDLRENDEDDESDRYSHHPYGRPDRTGRDGRGTPRSRKLQLSDVDWT